MADFISIIGILISPSDEKLWPYIIFRLKSDIQNCPITQTCIVLKSYTQTIRMIELEGLVLEEPQR